MALRLSSICLSLRLTADALRTAGFARSRAGPFTGIFFLVLLAAASALVFGIFPHFIDCGLFQRAPL
jgi:hypothetical protein